MGFGELGLRAQGMAVGDARCGLATVSVEQVAFDVGFPNRGALLASNIVRERYYAGVCIIRGPLFGVYGAERSSPQFFKGSLAFSSPAKLDK